MADAEARTGDLWSLRVLVRLQVKAVFFTTHPEKLCGP
jgi:hypothetical protein